MSKITINGPVTGSGHFFGDIIISTASEFISKNKQLNLTETEEELIRVIFANTESEEERAEMLSILKDRNNDRVNGTPKKKELEIWKKFQKKLVDTGMVLGSKLIETYIKAMVKEG